MEPLAPDLEALVLGPRTQRYLDDTFRHVHEARLLDGRVCLFCGVPGNTEFLTHLGKGVTPRLEGGTGREGAIVALGDDGILDLLDPPAWLYEAVAGGLITEYGRRVGS